MIPNSVVRQRKCPDSSWHLQSALMVEGQPKFATHRSTKARATISAVISLIGIASGHRVKRSTHVKRYEYPFESGKGPTKSRWTWSKLASGVLKEPKGHLLCLMTLDF